MCAWHILHYFATRHTVGVTHTTPRRFKSSFIRGHLKSSHRFWKTRHSAGRICYRQDQFILYFLAEIYREHIFPSSIDFHKKKYFFSSFAIDALGIWSSETNSAIDCDRPVDHRDRWFGHPIARTLIQSYAVSDISRRMDVYGLCFPYTVRRHSTRTIPRKVYVKSKAHEGEERVCEGPRRDDVAMLL